MQRRPAPLGDRPSAGPFLAGRLRAWAAPTAQAQVANDAFMLDGQAYSLAVLSLQPSHIYAILIVDLCLFLNFV
jgi:hypothetical protein